MSTEILIEISRGKDEQKPLSSRRGNSASGTEQQRGIQGPKLVLLAFWRGSNPASGRLVTSGDPRHSWSTGRLKHGSLY